jgi:hypothetical protein
VDVRKVIRKRFRHENEHTSVAGDVNAVVAANVGAKSSRTTVSSRQRVSDPGRRRQSLVKLDQEELMNKPEVRSTTDVPTEERVEERVERSEGHRAAPIDEDVVGELNAALPEEQPSEVKETQRGDDRAGRHHDGSD